MGMDPSATLVYGVKIGHVDGLYDEEDGYPEDIPDAVSRLIADKLGVDYVIDDDYVWSLLTEKLGIKVFDLAPDGADMEIFIGVDSHCANVYGWRVKTFDIGLPLKGHCDNALKAAKALMVEDPKLLWHLCADFS